MSHYVHEIQKDKKYRYVGRTVTFAFERTSDKVEPTFFLWIPLQFWLETAREETPENEFALISTAVKMRQIVKRKIILFGLQTLNSFFVFVFARIFVNISQGDLFALSWLIS